MSVRPEQINLAPTGMIFMKYDIQVIFENINLM